MAQWTAVPRTDIQVARRSDAEFFKREYIDSANMVRRSGGRSLRTWGVTVVSGPFGSSLKSSDYTDHGVPFIRISDLEHFSINPGNLVYISELSHKRIIGSELRQGDLVLSKVGNSIGIVSILDSDFTRANISENNIGIRFHPGVPLAHKHFVLAYLNCSFGQREILRRRSGNAQPKLNINDVYGLELPTATSVIQTEVSEIVRESQRQLRNSRALYKKAQQLIDAALNLNHLTSDSQVGCTARLSECLLHRRIDADFFQLPFRENESELAKHSPMRLDSLVHVAKGVEVGSGAYREDGRPFLRVSNIKEMDIERGASDKYISPELFAKLESYRPQVGELLLTKDGSPGIAYSVDTECDGIVSGGIVRLIRKRTDIPFEYLALAINSRACRMQVERECSGALILHWKPSSIRKLLIPVLSGPEMEKLAGFVSDAKRARRQSNELIQQAKRRVEQYIEEGTHP